MDDEQPAMQEQYPSVNMDDDADGTNQDALWPVTLIASSEVGVHRSQSDSRNGIPNGVATSTLDLRPVDLAEHGARSSLRSAANCGPVIAGPWRVDGLATRDSVVRG